MVLIRKGVSDKLRVVECVALVAHFCVGVAECHKGSDYAAHDAVGHPQFRCSKLDISASADLTLPRVVGGTW